MVEYIRWTYLVLIPVTLGFMVLHNLLDFLAKLIRRRPRKESGEMVMRMNLWFRIAHWGIMVSFPTLVFTGFALKYPEFWWSKPLLLWESAAGCARRRCTAPQPSSCSWPRSTTSCIWH